MFYWIFRPLMWLFYKVCYRVKVFGKENLIKKGKNIVVCNHLGKADVLAVGALYPNKTIWGYSGYTLDGELLEKSSRAHCDCTRELLENIDILVDGEFKEELKNLSLKFRGSSNQRIIDVQKSLRDGAVVMSEII